jgi:nucleotide-binding universal stress UspA family protein
MIQHILVPTDGSELSSAAAKYAITLAKDLGARITALHVMPEFQMFLEEGFVVPSTTSNSLKNQFQKQTEIRSKEILAQIRAEAAAAAVECEGISVTSAIPFEAIIKQSKKSKCDLIVMASHGRKGLEGLLLGSETAKVLTHSKIPVLVCR